MEILIHSSSCITWKTRIYTLPTPVIQVLPSFRECIFIYLYIHRHIDLHSSISTNQHSSERPEFFQVEMGSEEDQLLAQGVGGVRAVYASIYLVKL